jgi:hypothetical protein
MKKIIALTIVIMSFAGSAFAAAGPASGALSTAGAAIYGGSSAAVALAATSPLGKLSSGVTAIINFDSTSYAIGTKHVKGSKVFGTAADSTNMYFKASPAALITTTEVGTGSSNSNFSSGWTSM